jgi:dihydroneopterin aldolase
MTKLLVSVRSLDEAQLAYAADVDVIDLKEPNLGTLGAVKRSVIAEVVGLLKGKALISATIGDIHSDTAAMGAAIKATAATGVDIVKLGFFEPRLAAQQARELAPLARAYRLVAVLFADRPPDLSIVDALADAGFYGVMLDTADKGAGSLWDHFSMEGLQLFCEKAHAANLQCGLAGSIKINKIKYLLNLAPDYLGFRGAACTDSQRGADLDPGALAELRRQIPRVEVLTEVPCLETTFALA